MSNIVSSVYDLFARCFALPLPCGVTPYLVGSCRCGSKKSDIQGQAQTGSHWIALVPPEWRWPGLLPR